MSRSCTLLFCSALALFFACLPTLCTAADPITTVGDISQVTLYRGQALVTRTLTLPDSAEGVFELVVEDLPVQILADSLFSESDEGVEVRAVRYRERAVSEQPREEVQALMEELQGYQRELRTNEVKMKLLNDRSAYLDQLANFVAPTASTELSQGVLDAEQLQNMVLFSFEQRAEIAGELLELEMARDELQQSIGLVQRKIGELTTSTTRTVREAVLYVEKEEAGASTIHLNYLVNGCGWLPTYTIRTKSEEEMAQVEYNAIIQQMSGEDWSNVDLTLSTASPALSATTPGLAPFHVGLSSSGGGGNGLPQLPDEAYKAQVDSILEGQRSAYHSFQNAQSQGDQLSVNWGLNRSANDYQNLELQSGKVGSLGASDITEPTLSYHLENAVSLASRSDQQIVSILRTDLPSHLYYVATPVLSPYVHRETELTNACNDDFLGGRITVYLDGRFVGRGEIPTVTRGQRFIVGLGADSQLRSHRELVSRDEELQGGNRKWIFRYRIAIENFKGEAIPVRVIDRTPYSEDTDAIQLTLDKMEIPLSDNPQYQRSERSKGLLRWDVEVPPNSTGEEAMIIEYGYTVEFDRNYVLSAPTNDPNQMQEEFEDLQRMRYSY